MTKKDPPIRCRAPAKLSRAPCQNRVSENGKLCHLHREQAKSRIREQFWDKTEKALVIVGLIEVLRQAAAWTVHLYNSDEPDPFLNTWAMYKADRELPEDERVLPAEDLQEAEEQLWEGIGSLSDDQLTALIESEGM